MIQKSETLKLSGRLGAPFLPKAISLSASPQAPTLLGSFLVPPLLQLFFLLCALLATPLIRDLVSSLRCCSMLFLLKNRRQYPTRKKDTWFFVGVELRKLSTITLDNCSTNDAMINVLLGCLDSNYLLLGETAWLYRDVFVQLKQKDSNYKSVPSNEEWKLAKKICGKLKLFYDVTQLFSGTQVSTANIYFNKVCDIHVGLKKWVVSLNPVISSMACMMKRKFDKY
ncbi:hypothetical protein Ahy_A08g040102 [Arachis hypogaea]|uniref:hAT-like transposase RNase-H fold domain-containing protein n=1 Tax=Arachis hypogaea TaxID=3818 RepID=A0A445BYU6_ARAHY|nr:hypothetical protein Ahy_A08g040102 [Arachis hypogaea]